MMTKTTAEKFETISCIFRNGWKGSITRKTYNTFIRRFAGVEQNVPSWDTFKRYMIGGKLMQVANGYTIPTTYVVTDYDEGTEHWDVFQSRYYRFNRRRRMPRTAEEWQAIRVK